MEDESKKDVLSEFIEFYTSYPCLWKVNSKEYYNKNAKLTVPDILTEKLKEIERGAD